jgi:hypothetical protein
MARETVLAADPRQRRHVRRTAIMLGLVAVAVYAFYIWYALKHGHA